ncbi:hypothetical protein Tco_0222908 [Tanacetum coccineum]
METRILHLWWFSVLRTEIQKTADSCTRFSMKTPGQLNALKSTTQLLEQQSILYQQAFAQLFGDSLRTFTFQLSQHMNNLETLLNAETLHEMDSKSALSVIKVQFERFINSDLLKPLDIYSRSFSSDREKRAMSMETRDLKMTLNKVGVKTVADSTVPRFKRVQSSVTSSGDEKSSVCNRMKRLKREIGKEETIRVFMAKIQEVSPADQVILIRHWNQYKTHVQLMCLPM